MRRTNRALNRILLAILGIILLGAGAVLIAAGTLPGVADTWTTIGSNLTDQVRQLASTAPIPGPARSWWLVAGIGVLLLGAGLSAAWLASQGGGRTPRLAERSEGADGRTVVDVGLISAAVQDALSGNRNVLATSVSAWESRQGTALRLRMEARHGSSPRELADTAEQLVRQIDSWLGHPVPVLVRITSGARTRTSGAQRAK
ncbi:hypothetical protein [Arthrobacter sp. LFS091]|jgi:hypothetical protein|uniref:hypothetical protein n=1 Tax=Arthrobacter sp. LFS091 TaxID=3229892 RepID=UPI003A8127AF